MTAGGIEIAIATATDVDHVVASWHELMGTHAPLDPYFTTRDDAGIAFRRFATENITSKDDAIVFKATVDGTFAGYIMGFVKENPPVYKVTRVGYVSDIVVHPVYRRRGVGKRLVESILDWFRARGLERVEMSAAVKNQAAVAFWERAGFVPVMVQMYRNEPAPDE